MRELVIENTVVNDDSDCFVIAEIGHNHQGEVEKAKELIRLAKLCGANAVKLQKRDNKSLFTLEQYNKPYENENSFGRTYGEHREFLEFGAKEYVELKAFCKELGITFFATAFDVISADFLDDLDMPLYKIASGDLKNIPLIRHVAGFKKPLIVSTGGGTLEDIQRVYDAVMPINPHLCVLQCTASYPTQPQEMNLRVIVTLREQFPEIVVGLSDHFSGISMAPSAYVLGARVMEKHFTLNRAMKGTDHAFSLEPVGLQKLVRDLRRTRLALGDSVKAMLPIEAPAVLKMGKKLVAARDLEAGRVLTGADIAVKSPGDGVPPYELDNVIGQRLRSPLRADGDIRLDSLEAVDGPGA